MKKYYLIVNCEHPSIGKKIANHLFMSPIPLSRSDRRLKQINKVLKHKSLKNTFLYIQERL